ncbi:hypothetical protein COY26_05225 [Candidatus Woesearchaeota archaeon CG_4_10_14_0_2_um_filter_33_10]|nr:MAG: hypothetical protein AUJ83_02140 [Candidatus Woesearchaeota archaeon CG1_02_33_12]PIN78834.1 MAG: hypothetical protein COV14_01790 [Candidatus Woesearchaeota archaeon CG10_big_fil_rev_8_21_14_0_10_33_12]PIU72068.1 MAG: hypothetical protein COS79_04700 [Candidatus Woesearchaeota archaeon CG06_land_8_20_14_3_00_33_13]PIZ52004.1 MAG: hypothetical protein COY26_05225 [Candidatus Woesearchaeota archaeon CG_4_10_14_0_2_um_filter_33_10]
MEELKLNLKPLIKRLEVHTKRGLTSTLTGSYKSTFKGKGLDFVGYRPYDIGDDANMIDWKATLRSQDLLVKILVEERNVNIVFLVDVSSSMSFASIDKLKNEYAAELVASLSFAAIQAGDSVGLVMFNDKIVKFLPPNMGNKQYFMIINSLSNPKLYDGKFDFIKVINDLINSFKKGAIIVIVSDFIGLGKDWENYLRAVSEKFEVIGIMVRDPRDYEIPADVGQIVISDPYSDKEVLIDTAKIKDEYESVVKEQIKHIKETFINSKSDFLELRTDKPFLDYIIKFFLMRNKRRI